MRALVYTGPEGMEARDAPEPEPGPGEVLIAVEAVGICGSDMHAYLGHDERRPPPLILGHEAAGTVLEGPRRGGRVAINPLVTCGACPACRAGRENLCPDRQIISMPPRPGAFAERLAMPERNLVPVPDDVPSAKAALAEPIACGWHAVRLAREALGGLDGTTALVLGGGAIGLGAALVLAAEGSQVWIGETSALRRPGLARAGDLHVFDPAAESGPSAPDLVIDGVGIEATRAAASAAVRPGGVIAHIGLGSAAGGLDIRRMTLHEITLIGTYTYTAADFSATAEAIFTGRLGPLDWAESRPLADGPAAFAALRASQIAAPKVILIP